MMKERNFIVLFLLINILLSGYYVDSWNNSNNTSRVLPVLSLVNEGRWETDSYEHLTIDKSYINGHSYLDKAPLPSLLLYPFYFLYTKIFHVDSTTELPACIRLGAFLFGSIPFAVIVLLFYLILKRCVSAKKAVLLSMLPLYGSFIFVFSGTFFCHVLSACFALCAYYWAFEHQKKYLLSGFMLGLAFLSEYALAILLPVWALQLYFKTGSIRDAVKLVLGFLPALGFIMIYNAWITGNPFDMLYNHLSFPDFIVNNKILGFSYPVASVFYKLLFSDYRGLCWYMPALIVGFLYLVLHWRNIKWKTNPFLLPGLCLIILISSYHFWWGGWSYGPRHLTFAGVLLCLGLTKDITKGHPIWQIGLLAFSAVGFIMAWLAKATVVYSLPSDLIHPFQDRIVPYFSDKNFNPNVFPTMYLGMPAMWSNYLWPVVFAIAMIGLIVGQHYMSKNKKTQWPGQAGFI